MSETNKPIKSLCYKQYERRKHGTTNKYGEFVPQTVSISKTLSGKHGLFTCRLMAWPLSDVEAQALAMMDEQGKQQWVLDRGFVLEV